MARIPTTYYRVCDACGYVASIRSDDASAYTCDNCSSDRAWEFTSMTKAIQHSRDIKDRHTV